MTVSPEKIAEMLPCPFCGSTNKLAVTVYRASGDGGEPFDWGFTVICSAAGFSHAKNRGCGGSGAWGETEAEAIAAWNTRAHDPAARSQLDARTAERDEALRVAGNNADLWHEACKMVEEQAAARRAAEAQLARMGEALKAVLDLADHFDFRHQRLDGAFSPLRNTPAIAKVRSTLAENSRG